MFGLQSDALLGLLQQLTEETATDNSQPITASRPECRQATGATPTQMVGPTSAELESINELILFDHVYYKANPASKPQDQVSNNSIVLTTHNPVVINESVTVSTAPVEDQVAVQSQPDESNCIILDSDFENARDVRNDAVSMSVDSVLSEGLESLADLGHLLQQDQLTTAVTDLFVEEATTLQNNNTFVASKKCTQQSGTHAPFITQQKKKETNKKTSGSSSLIGHHDFCFDMSPDDLFHLDTVSGLSPVPSLSDSCYSSASSPSSESYSIMDDDVWAESFTELFPSLA